MEIRNVAIIAHVDHGKTTLVDEMLKQGGIYRENQAMVDRVMDSGDLERERGITILAKNTAVHYKDYKINIVDTPGHADFGGEVERILKMVNGVLLLVDAAEGPMPQTRFVLQKALELGHKVIVVINKIDRLDARIEQVMEEVLELLLDLNATDEQFDSPTIFCSARQGIAAYGPTDVGIDLTPLFETIINYIPAPEGDENAPLQVLVSSIDYNEYVGRIGIGRVERGMIRQNQEVAICDYHDPEHLEKGKIAALYSFEGLERKPITEAFAGEIVAFSGMADLTIGRTICAPDCPEPPGAPALREDLRSHHRDDLLRQRQPLRRPGRQIRHLTQPARPPGARASQGRVPARHRAGHRRLQRRRPRRDASVDPH